MQVQKQSQLQAHSAALYALCPGRTTGTLFSAGADKVVAEWDLESGKTNPFAIRTEHTIYSLLNLRNEFLVIGTIVGGMHVIHLESRKEMRHLKLHDKGIFHLVATAKGKVVAACADGSVSVWNSADWSLERHLKFSSEKIRRMALNPDQTLIAIACGDGMIRLVETNEFKLVSAFDAHIDGANSVHFLQNGDLLSGGKDAHLRRWSAEKGFELLAKVPAHNFAIYDIVGPKSDAFVATASRDKTVKIWKASDLQNPIRLDRAKAGGHLNSVNAAIWLEEEKLLATCGDDRSIIVWSVEA